MKFYWQKSSGWLQLVFHFGSENWEEQLKNTSPIAIFKKNTSPIATFKRNVNTAFDKLHSLNKLQGLIAWIYLRKENTVIAVKPIGN